MGLMLLEERLTKIWGEAVERRADNFVWASPDGYAYSNVHKTGVRSFNLDMPGLYLRATETGHFLVGDEPMEHARPAAFEEHEALKQKYLNIFRCKCWLSGCALECSFTERMSWLEWAKWQGITQDEISTWNLHF